MGRRDRERKEGVLAGTLLPFRQASLLKQLRWYIRAAQEEFGHDLANRMLLFAIERPEEGK